MMNFLITFSFWVQIMVYVIVLQVCKIHIGDTLNINIMVGIYDKMIYMDVICQLILVTIILEFIMASFILVVCISLRASLQGNHN